MRLGYVNGTIDLKVEVTALLEEHHDFYSIVHEKHMTKQFQTF